jgi:uncharacterized protein involved in exopolysaccharide biosynthesis
MKLRRLFVWLVAICACASLGFGVFGLSRRRADAPQTVANPHGRAPGRAVLLVAPMPPMPAGPEFPPVPDEDARLTPKAHAAILSLTRRQIFAMELQDPDNEIKKTGWFKAMHGDEYPDAAIDAFDKATTIDTLPDTPLVVVNVAIEPPADAATVANAFCSRYIQMRKDTQFAREAKVIELIDREKNLLDLELNEDVLKKMAEHELEISEAGVSPHLDIDDGKDMSQALSRAIVQATMEEADASAAIKGTRDEAGPNDTTKPASSDPAAQRVAAARRHLVVLRDAREALRKDSANIEVKLNDYDVLKKREKALRQKLDTLQDRLSSLRQFSLNSPWTDIRFAALASPN